MRILLLTQIVPYPPDSGPKVKTFHVLRYLAEHGHRVTLATFVRPAEERYLQELKAYCSEIYRVPLRRSRRSDVQAYTRSLVSGLPFLVTRDGKAEMYQLVRQLVRTGSYDIVHADQLTMAQFALAVHHSPSAGDYDREAMPIVFDAHNAVWKIVDRSRQTAPLYLRPVLSLEARRIKHYESRLIHEFDHTFAVSSIDQQALLQGAADWGDGNATATNLRSKITIIPITVDCMTLHPVQRKNTTPSILTVGTLFYPPNADGVRWFMREVFPLVRGKVPNAHLTILGPRPPKDIVGAGHDYSQSITVTGYVPDLLPYFESAAVVVVPVRAGSGMRVRILEALALAMPVVTTTAGLEGIDANNEEHVLVADDPEGFAHGVVRLLQDSQFGRQLGQNGRRLIERKYDCRIALPELETVYQALSRK
jgi:glycosyltransferase involved in cell wall biosynthesis